MQAAAGTSSSGGAQQEQLQQQVASLNKRIATLDHENQRLQSDVSRVTAFTAALQASAATAAAAVKAEAAGAPSQQQQSSKPDRHTSQSGAAAAARRTAGLTPVKPHRLSSSIKPMNSIGMPGTPTDPARAMADNEGGRQGRRQAAFSSDDGGSMASGSNMQSQAGGDSFAGGAADSAAGEGSGEQEGGEVAAGTAGAGVTYASQHWEEVKNLQSKVDALRCDNQGRFLQQVQAYLFHGWP
jgi:hypothetical protein